MIKDILENCYIIGHVGTFNWHKSKKSIWECIVYMSIIY